MYPKCNFLKNKVIIAEGILENNCPIMKYEIYSSTKIAELISVLSKFKKTIIKEPKATIISEMDVKNPNNPNPYSIPFLISLHVLGAIKPISFLYLYNNHQLIKLFITRMRQGYDNTRKGDRTLQSLERDERT